MTTDEVKIAIIVEQAEGAKSKIRTLGAHQKATNLVENGANTSPNQK